MLHEKDVYVNHSIHDFGEILAYPRGMPRRQIVDGLSEFYRQTNCPQRVFITPLQDVIRDDNTEKENQNCEFGYVEGNSFIAQADFSGDRYYFFQEVADALNRLEGRDIYHVREKYPCPSY